MTTIDRVSGQKVHKVIALISNSPSIQELLRKIYRLCSQILDRILAERVEFRDGAVATELLLV